MRTLFTKTLLVLSIMTTLSNSENLISPDNSLIQYYGRFDFSDKANVAFDWPGVYIKASFQGTSCKVVLKGTNCYDAYIDGKHKVTITAGPQSATYVIADKLSDKTHQLLLTKRSESSSVSFFQGIIIDSGKSLVKAPAPPVRKIEFIGDSYTAGFANESSSREYQSDKVESIILTTTNTYRAFGPICARAFDAQYQINALSGRGLVRNYNGFDPGKELPYYYNKTLLSVENSTWDFSKWNPDLIVIGIGINDLQADPPYPDSAQFDGEYSKLIQNLRQKHPGVKFICCATNIWPKNALIPRVKSIVEKQKAQGHKDIWYYEYTTKNGALYGHPDVNDHKIIADGLIPVIEEATGWKKVK